MNWKSWIVTGIAAAGLGSPAWPTEGLSWKWTEGQTRRFYIQAQVRLAEVMIRRPLQRERYTCKRFPAKSERDTILPVKTQGKTGEAGRPPQAFGERSLLPKVL